MKFLQNFIEIISQIFYKNHARFERLLLHSRRHLTIVTHDYGGGRGGGGLAIEQSFSGKYPLRT